MSSQNYLGEFEKIQEFLGGNAKVYKVRDKKYGHYRALKVLHEHIESEDDPRYINFMNECKKLLMLGNGGHPNILRIHRPLLRDNRAMVEMDFIEGDDLYEYLKKNKFVPIDEVMKMLTDIGSALSFCHVDIYKYCINRDEDNLPDDPEDGHKVVIDDDARERLINKYRIVHNDMHARNVIRRIDGTYILLDFGLAVNDNEANNGSRISNGVIQYRAPEKWNGQTITPAVDIYGFGIMLYEYLAGRLPFPFNGNIKIRKDVDEHIQAHCEQVPQPIFPLRKQAYELAHPGETLNEPDYPAWLEELIMKCLAKNPSDRFADGKELSEYVKAQLTQSSQQYNKLIQHLDDVENELQRVKSQRDKELKEAMDKARIIQQEFEERKLEADAQMALVKEQLEEEKAAAEARIKQLEEQKKASDNKVVELQQQREQEMREVANKVKQLEEQLARQQREAEEKLKEWQTQYRQEVSTKLRDEHSDELIIEAVLAQPALNGDDEKSPQDTDSGNTTDNDFWEIPVLSVVRKEDIDDNTHRNTKENNHPIVQPQPSPRQTPVVKPPVAPPQSLHETTQPDKKSNLRTIIAWMILALIALYAIIILITYNL